jgi:16S rRNA (guanine966-N2)-methyltransferase
MADVRIIGGIYKKKRLLSVSGMETRPTADRLRETLFNILSFDVRDAVVLDLFAGTGALGLEALSRGASSCVFVENSREALEVIRKNVASCPAFSGRVSIVCKDVSRDLHGFKNTRPPFTLVFADPPYGKGLIPVALEALSVSGCLAENARIVVEHDANDEIPPPPAGFVREDQRTYGRTTLTFFTFTPRPE